MAKVKLNEEQKSRSGYIFEFYAQKDKLSEQDCDQIAVLTDTIFAEALKDGEVSADDNPDDFIDTAVLDFKAKKLPRIYIQSEEKERKKVDRVRKVDNIKLYLFSIIKEALQSQGIAITSEKNEVEISFTYEKEDYTLKLTKHRKKK